MPPKLNQTKDGKMDVTERYRQNGPLLLSQDCPMVRWIAPKGGGVPPLPQDRSLRLSASPVDPQRLLVVLLRKRS